MSLNKYLATGISVGFALALIFYKAGNAPAWTLIWPIFGASNQLVAAIGLMALGVWVIRALKKSAKFIIYPMFFMLTTTIVALVQMLLNPKTNMVVFSFDLVLLVLTLLLLKEAYAALKKKD
jgi:carbon starvation protein